LAFAAVRLLPSGALDPSFGEGGLATVPIGAAAIANSVAVQHDGRIVLGGTVVAGHIAVAAARLDPDGSIDRSFGSAGVTILSPAAAAWGMALERNGDIAFGGETAGGLVLGSAVSLLSPELGLLPTNVVQTLTAGGIRYFAARLLPNGQPDPTFGSGGIVSLTIDATAIAFAVAATPDGRIVLAGNAFTNRLVTVAVRLLPNGRLDPTFGTDGVVSLPVWQGVNAMVLKPKGNMLIAGVGATVIELQADGRPAAAFGNDGIASPQPGSAGAANGVALSPHRIVLAGASTVNGRTVLSVMRLGQ
jgi:uncharacterized delta-60 repeat protein